MFQFRPLCAQDLSWLDQAAALGAWETMSPEQRMRVHPVLAAQHAAVQLRQLLATPGVAGVAALQGPYPVGYVLVGVAPDSSTEEPTGHLLDLWVTPLHRRRGVGSQLLRLAEQWAASLGLRKMKLWSGLHNRPAVAFAERHGYSPAGLIGVKDL